MMRHDDHKEHDLSGDRTATDPVCGMSVDVETAKHVSEHAGETFYFCSAKCREKFDTRPEIFIDPALKAAPPERDDEIYTCPMHPEIAQVDPGTCPICGRALEPKGIPMTDGTSEEYLDFRSRFVVSSVLTVPLAIIAMGRHFAPQAFAIISAPLFDWIELILATPVVLWLAPSGFGDTVPGTPFPGDFLPYQALMAQFGLFIGSNPLVKPWLRMAGPPRC